MTIPVFTRCGKEILRDGMHYVDAVDEDAAQAILDAFARPGSIADMIDAEAAKRSSHIRRFARVIADGIRNCFDVVDEAR